MMLIHPRTPVCMQIGVGTYANDSLEIWRPDEPILMIIRMPDEYARDLQEIK